MADVPKKKSRLLWIAIAAIAVIVVVGVGALLLGGACLGSFLLFQNQGGSVVNIYDESLYLTDGDYVYYDINAEAGERLDIKVTSDTLAVDVFVMNPEQFEEYESGASLPAAGTEDTLMSKYLISHETVSYNVPKAGAYYVVIDNTNFPKGGAFAKSDITASIVIDSVQ